MKTTNYKVLSYAAAVAAMLGTSMAYDVPIECTTECRNPMLLLPIGEETRRAIIMIEPQGPSALDIAREEMIRSSFRKQQDITINVK